MSLAELTKYLLSDEFAGRLLRLRIEIDHRGGSVPSNLAADALAIDPSLVPVLFSWLGAWITTEETIDRLGMSRNAECTLGAIH